MSKPLATKVSTPLSEMSTLGPISDFLSPVSCDSLVLLSLRCEWGAVLSLSLSHTGHWKFNMAPHGKELSEDLKKRHCCSTQRWCRLQEDCQDPEPELQQKCKYGRDHTAFNRTGSTQNRPRHAQPKKLSARAQRHIQRLCLGNRCMSAASIAAEVEGVGGVSLLVLRPYTAHCIRLVCMRVVPEGSLF